MVFIFHLAISETRKSRTSTVQTKILAILEGDVGFLGCGLRGSGAQGLGDAMLPRSIVSPGFGVTGPNALPTVGRVSIWLVLRTKLPEYSTSGATFNSNRPSRDLSCENTVLLSIVSGGTAPWTRIKNSDVGLPSGPTTLPVIVAAGRITTLIRSPVNDHSRLPRAMQLAKFAEQKWIGRKSERESS